MHQVLLLNIDYSPLEVISWRDAIDKLFLGKVELVEAYVGQFIRSPSTRMALPAVVRLVTGYAKRRVRLSRRHILARDGFTCQYCGIRPRRASGLPRLEELTIDHVVPRVQAQHGWVCLPWSGKRVRVTSWENVLTACAECNGRKGGRTPAEAGMTMRRTPRAPSPIDLAWMSVNRVRIPTEWQDYLPRESPWREYWDVELAS